MKRFGDPEVKYLWSGSEEKAPSRLMASRFRNIGAQ